MELKYLKTFKTIVEEGSFGRAAERLCYSQSTVTFQIQQLEKELSVKLFEKIGRRMALTASAREILPHIDTILGEMAVIENQGKELREFAGELNISMAETLLTYKSQKALKLFREAAPSVRLSLQTQNCYAVREPLMNGSVDCGFQYDVGGYGDSLCVEKLAEYDLALVCSPVLTDRDYITPHSRKNVCLIVEDKNSIFLRQFEQYLTARDISLGSIMELRGIEGIKRSVESNVGIAVLPRFTVERELNEGTLLEIPTEMKKNTVTAVCICHKNKWQSPAMKAFISLMKETI
ncbi:MAG: LysR family transcriptional regulator [Clostridia bacterium]|nr:LysR family transcriptional regulator [Clostridia bacterium]